MIAFIADTQKSGARIVRERFGGGAKVKAGRVYLSSGAKPDGNIITTENQLRGMEIEGFIILEPTTKHQMLMVELRLRTASNGKPIIKD